MASRGDGAGRGEGGGGGAPPSGHARPDELGGRVRPPLGLVFLVVFLDFVGFSIVFPLFPAMLEHYVALEGPGSAVTRLVERLDSLAGTSEFAVVALFGGVLGSLYSLLQFLFAPVWGGLSDRIGRRPVLLLTLGGTGVAYLLWVFAGSFWLLVASRLLGGLMAGNVSTASAVVADTTSGRERAKGMGIVGMAIGLGFVLGPALGALATWTIGGADGEWTRGFALNPFSLPALASLVLAAANLAVVAARLPETRSPRAAGAPERTLNPFARIRALALPGVTGANLTYFLAFVAFSAMEFTLTFLAVERFGFDVRDNAAMFVFVGVVVALVNGVAVRRLAPLHGEKRLVVVGLVLLLPGFLAIGWTQSIALLYVGLACFAVGSALVTPCLSSLASRYAPEDAQGLVLGAFRSLGALSRAAGPFLGGLLYWSFGSSAPYTAGAVFLAVPLLIAARLPPVPPGD